MKMPLGMEVASAQATLCSMGTQPPSPKAAQQDVTPEQTDFGKDVILFVFIYFLLFVYFITF